ncbi:MAG TPA: hypothetical protein VHQ41_02770 [Patescibacteria group bacterium]|nr:hypothetical protein [Patescibacteria group bacterium]
MKRSIIMIVAMFFATMFYANIAHACTLAEPELTTKQQFDAADVVFVGEVINVKTRSIGLYDWLGIEQKDTPKKFTLDLVDVTFYVSANEKGTKQFDQITVSTPRQESLCGIEAWASTRWKDTWKVYARKDKNGLITELGSGTEFWQRPKILK